MWLPLLHKIADRTEKIALEYFTKVDLAVSYKKDRSPVSEADQKIEQWVRDFMRKKDPAVGLFGEEYGEDTNKDLRLIIDPIDGTRNFIRGIPIFATLLGIEQNGEIIAGLVSAPGLKTRWFAEKGHGAHMINAITKQKVQLAVSQIKKLRQAQLFHSSLSGNEVRDQIKPTLLSIINATERQRGFGDFYQHVLVAQGSGEAAVDPHVKPWDIAPLKIILEEAGGSLLSFSGEPTIYAGNALSTNGLVAPALLKHLPASSR